MESIVNEILKIFSFSNYFIKLGLSEDASAGLSFLIVIFLLWILKYTITKIYKRYRNSLLAKNLYPQFDKQSIIDATSSYISTYWQNASPSIDDEPEMNIKHVIRQKLIPFFLKIGFNEMKGAVKFHIILADSGMGKTTFMINLYMKYISFWNFSRKKGSKIKLYRLSYSNTLDLVKKIDLEEAKDTILLLDALDEDPYIISKSPNISNEDSFIKRVDEIIEVANNFKEIVFTCRTQYFPNQEHNPLELKMKRPDEKGYYKLKKLYISPFSKKEIRRYLNKQYPFWKFWKFEEKKRAFNLIENTPKLAVRPMLLKYIKDLASEERNYRTTKEIYRTLIDKWYNRESLKRKFEKDREIFIQNLEKLSVEISLIIFHQFGMNKDLSISKDQAILIAKKNDIKLDPFEVTGQSLLTCDGYGNWKFAHKSIFEYFIYKISEKNVSILIQLLQRKFMGLDMVRTFYIEGHRYFGILSFDSLPITVFLPDQTNQIENYLINIEKNKVNDDTNTRVNKLIRWVENNIKIYKKIHNLKLEKTKLYHTGILGLKKAESRPYREKRVFRFDKEKREFTYSDYEFHWGVVIINNMIKFDVYI